jgi:CrcB protein
LEAWTRVIWLSIGGVLGVNARYWLGVWMSRWAPAPWATFTINVTGSFAIGFLTLTLTRWVPHPHLRLMVLTGFLGGYTTFSTYAFESAVLWDRGARRLALANMFGSIVVGVVAAFSGMALARDVLIPARERAASMQRASPAEAAPRKEAP